MHRVQGRQDGADQRPYKADAQGDLAKFDAVIDKPGAKVQGVEWYSGYGTEIRAAHLITESMGIA